MMSIKVDDVDGNCVVHAIADDVGKVDPIKLPQMPKSTNTTPPLTPNQRAQLRAQSFCDDETIKRWARGERVWEATALRLEHAAKAIGIEVPSHRHADHRASEHHRGGAAGRGGATMMSIKVDDVDGNCVVHAIADDVGKVDPIPEAFPGASVRLTVERFAGATIIDGLTVAELAARAQVDPRTVRKRLRGEKIRGLAGARIDRALAELGQNDGHFKGALS